MTAPVAVIMSVLGLFWSAHARVNAIVLGHPFSVPVLGIVSVTLVLTLAALVLWLMRTMARDSLYVLRRAAA